MIIDTSAIVAIWKQELGFEKLTEALLAAESVSISAATLVELFAVIDSRERPEVSRQLDSLLAKFGVRSVPFDAEQAVIARGAYRDFGRGSGHPAHLNLGDCYSYALAVQSGEPLLFVGNDFDKTGISAALDT